MDLTFLSTGLINDCSECCDIFGIDHNNIAEVQNFKQDIETEAILDEGSISRSACDLCGTTLQGQRFIAHGRDENEDIVHLDICVDCVDKVNKG